MKIINPDLLREMREPGHCGWCGRYCRLREGHHLQARGFGGGCRLDVRCLMISLGSSLMFSCNCHRKMTDRKIDPEDVLWKVAKREGVSPESIVAVRDLILRLDKSASRARVEYEMERSEFTAEARALLWKSIGERT